MALDRLERLFQAALLHPPPEREAFIRAACPDDPALRADLLGLLEADEEAQDEAFLNRPAADDMGLPSLTPGGPPAPLEEAAAQDDDLKGTRAGPYTIIRKLGHGGMGTVYLASRERPFKQYVAVKIIRQGLASRDVLLRFEMERQILASLNHPNIARLLDGGVTEARPPGAGLPYFAMEYVEGVPLTRYCDQHRLSIEDRLRLFQRVCRAVHYAHQNLVLHRDLKPSNILVTQQQVVKLLDFGIAKLLNPALSPVEMPVTVTGMQVLTPEYASPEQVRGEVLTTASDVYSLGVILYELLTGHRPYRFTQNSPLEILQVVCEQEPQKPSTMVRHSETLTRNDGSTAQIDPQAVGEARSESVDRLRRRLQGDLDNIVMTALRKEPGRRYVSAQQMNQDLENYLSGELVAARAATLGYRMQKFIRRNRAWVAAALFALVALVGGLGVALSKAAEASLQRDRARAETLRAEQEARKAAEVKTFLLSLFETADPAVAESDSVLLRDVLDAGAERIKTALSQQPAVQAEMLDVIAQAYQNLGRYEEAEASFEQALAVQQRIYGEAHPDVASSLKSLADLMVSQDRLDRAETLVQQHLDLVRTLNGPAHPSVQLALYQLWTVTHLKGRAATADSLFEAVMAMQEELPDMDDPDRARTLGNVATVLYHKRQYPEAERMARRALDMERRLHGNRHPGVADQLQLLSDALVAQQRYREAEPLARESVALQQSLHPEGHPEVVSSLRSLGAALEGQGRAAEAEQLFRDAIENVQNLRGDNRLKLAQYYRPLASMLYDRGAYDEAEQLYRELIAIYGQHHGLQALTTIEMRERLGDALRGRGAFEEAERLLLDSYRTLRTTQGEANLYTRAAVRRLVALYEAWDRPGEAARYEALLER